MDIKQEVSFVFRKLGMDVQKVSVITAGSNNRVLHVECKQGEYIIKFPMQRIEEGEAFEKNKDKLFNGELSLEREMYILDLIRSRHVPAPKYFGTFDTAAGRCIVLEKVAGTGLAKYMQGQNYSLDVFLLVMRSLGENFRKLHRIRFSSFGNLMENGEIFPNHFHNFIDRYQSVNDMVLSLCRSKGCFSEAEYALVEAFLQTKFGYFKNRLDLDVRPATLVITDMHEGNFHVQNHRVSGFFDVESAQAAPMEFELYCIRFFLSNFFGQAEFDLAERSFWAAYYGQEILPDKDTDEILDFFSFLRLLELCESYWGYVDGIRDTWGAKIKALALHYIQTNQIDYIALGEIWRQRDGQPISAIRTV